MPSMMAKSRDVNEYISRFPPDIRKVLQKMRATIKKAAPKAVETISYGMPAFRMKTVLVYFAAFSGHFSFFPTSSPVKAFKKELAGYKTSKGTIHFEPDKPIPYGLITKIVRFRVKEDAAMSGKNK